MNEYGEPDADGYYTLKFTAGAKNMPSIHAQAKKVVLVIDCSLSMACATDYVRGTDATTGKLEAEKIADSYDKTRWKAMYDSVSAFLNAFLPEGNTTNSVAVQVRLLVMLKMLRQLPMHSMEYLMKIYLILTRVVG